MDNPSTRIRRQIFSEGLAAEAGEIARSFFLDRENVNVESKGPFDFVSEADRVVEQKIRDRIMQKYPGDNIVGEEGGGIESDAFWSIDPIDGTSNFLAGIPLWGVSIGYCENGEPAVGAIHIPMLSILLSASRDAAGIRYNGDVKHAPPASPIPTVILGQSPYWEIGSYRHAENIFHRALLECLNYRCSVIGTAFAALGLTHGYYEEHSNIWDVAAGFVIAQQMGLKSSIVRSDGDEKLTISVLTSQLHDRIGEELAQRCRLPESGVG